MNIKTLENGRAILYDENGVAKAALERCSRCGELVDPHFVEVGYTPSGKAVCRPCWPSIDDRSMAMRELAIPPEYGQSEIADFSPGVRMRMKEWPDQYPMFGIFGLQGRGKTRLVWAVARALHRHRRFVTVVDCRQAQVEWSGSQRREDFLRRWIRAGLLVLDDITGGSLSPGWVATIDKVLDARKQENMPTMVVTCSRGQELESIFGAACWSRLQAMKWLNWPAKEPDRRPRGNDTARAHASTAEGRR